MVLLRNAENVSIITEGLLAETPLSLIGQFYFEFEYDGKRIGLWPRNEFFNDRFRAMVMKYQPRKGTEGEQRVKQVFIADLMAAREDNLFEWRDVALT